jgi:DNA-binding transcriptional regulator YiaG
MLYTVVHTVDKICHGRTKKTELQRRNNVIPCHIVDNMATDDALMNKMRARRGLPDPARRRGIRTAAGVTQADIAAPLGVTRAAVSRWELGEREPRGALLEAYLSLLERLRREILA